MFLWQKNGGVSAFSFTLWKFHDALFQLDKEVPQNKYSESVLNLTPASGWDQKRNSICV